MLVHHRVTPSIGVLLLPPAWDASPSQGYPQQRSITTPPGWDASPFQGNWHLVFDVWSSITPGAFLVKTFAWRLCVGNGHHGSQYVYTTLPRSTMALYVCVEPRAVGRRDCVILVSRHGLLSVIHIDTNIYIKHSHLFSYPEVPHKPCNTST